MSATGWIKLYRSILGQPWYDDSHAVHLFIHLLISANHKGKQAIWDGSIIELQPGQLITGRKKLSAETGINESKVQRLLKKFEMYQQIEQQTNNVSRLISIVSWGVFQSGEQQTNSKRTTSEQQVNNLRTLYKNERMKEEKEEEEEAANNFEQWKNEVLEDQIFIEQVGMQYRIRLDQIESMLEEFVSYKKSIGETDHRDFADFRKNFRLWIPKKINEIKKDANGKSRNHKNLISDEQARRVFAKLTDAGY